MDVKAGRHGSSGPAATFMQGLSPTSVMGLDVTLNMTPAELNFVVYGTMTFNFESGNSYQCPNFRVAQGHSQFSNNWWMGSKDCAHIPESHQIVCCCGKKFCNAATGILTGYAISITAGDNDHEF
jgi:hypothetical protein